MTSIINNTNINKRKKIIYIALILVLISIFILLILPNVFADASKDSLNIFEKIIKTLAISYNSETVYDILVKSPIYTPNTAINTFIESVMTVSRAFAAAWFLVTILIEVVNEFSSGKEASMDRFIPVFVKAAVTLMLIVSIDEAIVGIQQGMPAFLNQINNAINITGDVKAVLETAGNNLAGIIFSKGGEGFLSMIVAGLVLKFIQMLLNGVILFVVYLSCYSIIIELTLRRIFMPIALVNFMNDGVRGPGMRFIKKFIALYLRTFITLAAFGLSDKLSNDALKTFIESQNSFAALSSENTISDPINATLSLLKYNFIFTIAASKFARKGSELANELVGV